jgi:KEOPS complex subunit Cgi121
MTVDPVVSRTEDMKAWIVRVHAEGAKAAIGRLLRLAEANDSEILVVRSDLVFGSDHVRSALYHARKAFESGRNVSASLAMETLLYASGERQLNSAIRKMSVPEDAREFVVAVISGAVPVSASDSTELSGKVECRREDLLRFGIGEAEILTVPGRDPNELVLERVAAVDAIKK